MLPRSSLAVIATMACNGVARPVDPERPKSGAATVTVAIEPGVGEEPWLAFRDGDVGWEHIDAGATRTITGRVFEVAAHCPSLPHRSVARSYLYRVRRGDASRIEIERCADDAPRAPSQTVKLTLPNVSPSRSLRIHTYGNSVPKVIETDPFTTDTSGDVTAPRGQHDTVFVEGISEALDNFSGERLLIRRDIFFSTGSRKRVDLAASARIEAAQLTVDGALPDEQVAATAHLVTSRGTVAMLSNDNQPPFEVRRAGATTLGRGDRQLFQVSATTEPSPPSGTKRHVRGTATALRLPPLVDAPAVQGEVAQAVVTWTPKTTFDWYELTSQGGTGTFSFRSPTKSLGAKVTFSLPPPVPWFESTWHSEERESWTLTGWRGPANAPWSAWTELSQRTIPPTGPEPVDPTDAP